MYSISFYLALASDNIIHYHVVCKHSMQYSYFMAHLKNIEKLQNILGKLIWWKNESQKERGICWECRKCILCTSIHDEL